ncbi:MAG: hypothetical protein ABGX31_08155 [bacterium]
MSLGHGVNHGKEFVRFLCVLGGFDPLFSRFVGVFCGEEVGVLFGEVVGVFCGEVVGLLRGEVAGAFCGEAVGRFGDSVGDNGNSGCLVGAGRGDVVGRNVANFKP